MVLLLITLSSLSGYDYNKSSTLINFCCSFTSDMGYNTSGNCHQRTEKVTPPEVVLFLTQLEHLGVLPSVLCFFRHLFVRHQVGTNSLRCG